MYARRLRWLPLGASTPPLRIGTMAHHLLAAIFSGCSGQQAVDSCSEEVSKWLAAPEVADDSKVLQSAIKEWNVARVMVDKWLSVFGHPSDETPPWKVLAVEQTITTQLSIEGEKNSQRQSLMIGGTIDAAVQIGDDIWLVDHKTTSDWPSERVQGLSFDLQARTYRKLWDDLHPERPCIGFIHNVLMKPTIRLKKNQSYEEYYEEVGEWYNLKMADNPNQVPFLRSRIRFNEPPLAENRELWQVCLDEAKWAMPEPNLNVFYRNRGACKEYRRMCPYMALCQSNPVMWPELLANSGLFFRGESPSAELQSKKTLADDLTD